MASLTLRRRKFAENDRASHCSIVDRAAPARADARWRTAMSRRGYRMPPPGLHVNNGPDGTLQVYFGVSLTSKQVSGSRPILADRRVLIPVIQAASVAPPWRTRIGTGAEPSHLSKGSLPVRRAATFHGCVRPFMRCGKDRFQAVGESAACGRAGWARNGPLPSVRRVEADLSATSAFDPP